ncbi:MAG: hypothetical protein HRT82_12745 [Henriciella sp.]|nr:hypothetical protein [Henriciella sp.]
MLKIGARGVKTVHRCEGRTHNLNEEPAETNEEPVETEDQTIVPHNSGPSHSGPLRRIIEECGKHPFVTGLLAIVGVMAFALSVVSFGFDRSESNASSQAQKNIADQVEAVEKKVSAIPGATPESAEFVPIDASLDPTKHYVDNIVFSRENGGRFHGGVEEKEEFGIQQWLFKNDERAFSHHFAFEFSVTSLSDVHFVQIAPYLVTEVREVSPVPEDMIMYYSGGRGAGAVAWEFVPRIPAKPGIYFSPPTVRNGDEPRTDTDFLRLMPREPEEFLVWPQIDAGWIYDMRVGLHYKYKDKHRVHWVTPFFRNGMPKQAIPQWDFGYTYYLKMYDGAEGDDPSAVLSRAKSDLEFVKQGKVFRPEQISAIMAEYQ